MNKSESIAELAAALANAQAEIKAAEKNASNPFLKNKYADLGSVIDAAREPLTKNGIAVTQWVQNEGNFIEVETLVSHKSGEWMSSAFSLPMADEKGKSIAQAAGSTITYIRRYAYAAAVGIYAGDDDDGNASAKNTERKPQAQQAQMTLEQATAITNSEGLPYGEIDTESLAHIFNNAKAPADKREAARLIIESRKN